MPDCGVHYLWFAFVGFLSRSPPPPLPQPALCFMAQSVELPEVQDYWGCTTLDDLFPKETSETAKFKVRMKRWYARGPRGCRRGPSPKQPVPGSAPSADPHRAGRCVPVGPGEDGPAKGEGRGSRGGGVGAAGHPDPMSGQGWTTPPPDRSMRRGASSVSPSASDAPHILEEDTPELYT